MDSNEYCKKGKITFKTKANVIVKIEVCYGILLTDVTRKTELNKRLLMMDNDEAVKQRILVPYEKAKILKNNLRDLNYFTDFEINIEEYPCYITVMF